MIYFRLLQSICRFCLFDNLHTAIVQAPWQVKNPIWPKEICPELHLTKSYPFSWTETVGGWRTQFLRVQSLQPFGTKQPILPENAKLLSVKGRNQDWNGFKWVINSDKTKSMSKPHQHQDFTRLYLTRQSHKSRAPTKTSEDCSVMWTEPLWHFSSCCAAL